MKVLLLGGTGSMGIPLVQILKENGIETFVTSRKNIKSDGNLHYLQGDAKNLAFLQTVLQKESWNAIIDFMIYDTQSFKERVELLLNNTKQYIFLSSARVYADSEQPITELSSRLLDISQDTDYLETDEYALAKARQENILKDSPNKNWTIIRPYITYNENRLQLGVLEKEEWLYRALKGRTIILSSDIIKKTTTLTYGVDVAKGISKIIGNPKALNEVFHITLNKDITWDEVLNIYIYVLEKHLGYKPKVLLLNINEFLKCKNTKYQIYYDRLYDRTFDNTKISEYIDTNSFTNTETGLKYCLEIFLQTPKFSFINWRDEAIKDRQTKEHTSLKEISNIKSKVKYLIYRYGLMK